MTKIIKKKSNAGRKPIDDKKVTVCLYVRESVIKNKGGMETAKKMCYDFLGVEG